MKENKVIEDVIGEISRIRAKTLELPAILHHESEIKNEILSSLTEVERKVRSLTMKGGKDA